MSELEQDALRYQWIKHQTNLHLRTNPLFGTPWTHVETGKPYYPSHCLDVNGTRFEGIEHLDDLIDAAMQLYPFNQSH